MAWDGYFEIDGTEIINVARTEAYAAEKPWFTALFKADDLPAMLDDGTYSTPAADEAPWYDADEPASAEFLGVYPLEVSGIESSSRVSTVLQSTNDGGVPGRVRHETKTVVFNTALLAETERGAEYGIRWLNRALLGAKCSRDLSTEHALGASLGFLAYEPTYTPGESPTAALAALSRVLRRFVVNVGPHINAKRALSCGGQVWIASFTGVAGTPFQFGLSRPIIQGYLDPSVTDPWVPGVVAGDFDTVSSAYTEVPCGEDLYDPIFDPYCPALIIPPPPPSIPLGCFDPPTEWDRRSIAIPGENVPLWGEVAPVVTLHAVDAVRNARVRFYEDPNGDLDPSEDPCAYVADIVVSYIPAGASLIVDASLEEVYVIMEDGDNRRADSLVYSTNSTPIEWPYLTCGFDHIMTIDVPDGETSIPSVDVALVPRIY